MSLFYLLTCTYANAHVNRRSSKGVHSIVYDGELVYHFMLFNLALMKMALRRSIIGIIDMKLIYIFIKC